MDCNRRNAKKCPCLAKTCWKSEATHPEMDLQNQGETWPRSNHQPPPQHQSSFPWRQIGLRLVYSMGSSNTTSHGIQAWMMADQENPKGIKMRRQRNLVWKDDLSFSTWALWRYVSKTKAVHSQACFVHILPVAVGVKCAHSNCSIANSSVMLHSHYCQASLDRYGFIILHDFPRSVCKFAWNPKLRSTATGARMPNHQGLWRKNYNSVSR